MSAARLRLARTSRDFQDKVGHEQAVFMTRWGARGEVAGRGVKARGGVLVDPLVASAAIYITTLIAVGIRQVPLLYDLTLGQPFVILMALSTTFVWNLNYFIAVSCKFCYIEKLFTT